MCETSKDMKTRVSYGNRLFPRPREWAGDRPQIIIIFPTMLRAIANDLSEREPQLAAMIEQVAEEWDDGDLDTNIARLTEVLAHGDRLTEAQAERLGRARKELRGRVS